MKAFIRKADEDESCPMVPGIGIAAWMLVLPDGARCYALTFSDCWVAFDMAIKVSIDALTNLESTVVM